MRSSTCPSRSGFTLIELMIVISIISIIAAIAIPNLIEARKGANESAAIGALRTLVTTQALFRDSDAEQDGQADYATSLHELQHAGLDAVLASGTKSGYRFELYTLGANPSCWGAYAIAISPATGEKTFFANDTERIVTATGTAPTSSSAVVDAGNGGTTACTPENVGTPAAPIATSTEIAAFNAALQEQARDTARMLNNVHGGGEALELALDLLAQNPGGAPLYLAFDTNGDQALGWDELLSFDYGGAARVLKSALVPGGDPGPAIGADFDLLLDTFDWSELLASPLQLDDPTEPLPAVSIAALPDALSARALLESLDMPLTTGQQKCVNGTNKNARLVLDGVGDVVTSCIGDHNAGLDPDLAACFSRDPNGRIGKGITKTFEHAAAACAGSDKHGVAKDPLIFGRDPNAVLAAALDALSAFPSAIYGVPTDPSDPYPAAIDELTDANAAVCQEKVAAATAKCWDTMNVAFIQCKKNALKDKKEPFAAGARTDAELETCVLDDPKGKIAKACNLGNAADKKVDGLMKALVNECVDAGVDLALAFPGCGSADADVVHDCQEARIACVACRGMNAADDLDAGCDQLDDGAANDSCADRCGDGDVEFPEACDDANTAPGDGCSARCAVETGCTCGGTPSVCDCGPPDCDNLSVPFPAACAENTPATADTSCSAILTAQPGAPSGAYFVDADGAGPAPAAPVYCDMTTDGGGWTAIFVGKNGSANAFDRFDQGFYGGAFSDPRHKYLQRKPPHDHLASAELAVSCGAAMVKFPMTEQARQFFVSGTRSAWVRLTPTVIAGTVPKVPNWLWTGDAGARGFVFAKDQASFASTFASSYDAGALHDFCNGTPDQTSVVRVFYREVAPTPVLNTPETAATSCAVINRGTLGAVSGDYYIDPDGAGTAAPAVAHCDMTTDGGGWTAIFVGKNGSTNVFDRFDQPAYAAICTDPATRCLRRAPATLPVGSELAVSCGAAMVRFPMTQPARDFLVSGAQSVWVSLTPTVIAGTVVSAPNWLWTGSGGDFGFIFTRDQTAGVSTFGSSYAASDAYDYCNGTFDQASTLRVYYREPAPVCADGVLDAPESCDDGDTDPGDGCDATCGVEAGWDCTGEPSVCTAICGNGLVDGPESCDDGDTDSGDGCDAMCEVEAGWDCPGEPSLCTAICGNGFVDGPESCDDGDTDPGDGCDATCGIEAGWDCPGEPSLCTAICGNGLVDGPESCDDGDTDPGDGCDATCEVEPGCSCTGEPSSCTCGGAGAPEVTEVAVLATPAQSCVPIAVVVSDPEGDRADILVEFRTAAGEAFRRLTFAPVDPGTAFEGAYGLSTSAAGEPHVFVWDSFADLGRAESTTVEIRVTPFDARTGSVGVANSAVGVVADNALAFAAAEPIDLFGGQVVDLDGGELGGDGADDIAAAIPNYGAIFVLEQDSPGTFQVTDTGGANQPSAVAVAEVLGNGRRQLVVTSQAFDPGFPDEVNILDKDPALGFFVSVATVEVGDEPQDVVAADFDRDGKVDVATANLASSDVSVALQVAPNAFGPEVRYPVGAAPLALAAGDVNRDGLLDLVVGNSATASISLLLQNAGSPGSFLPATSHSLPAGAADLSIADLNGDGALDVVTVTATDRLVELRGDGMGGLTAVQDVPPAAGASGASALAVADLDDDGRLDAVVTYAGTGGAAVFLQELGGSLTFHDLESTGGGTVNVVARDFDRDGDLDLVTADPGTGNLHFLRNTLPRICSSTAGRRVTRNAFVGAGARGLAIADLNGDGHRDVASVASGTGVVRVHAGVGDGGLVAVAELAGPGDAADIAAGDVDGDGIADLVVTSRATDSVHVFLQDALSPFAFSAAPPTSVGSNPGPVALGHLDSDAVFEIVVLDESGDLKVLASGGGQSTTAVGAGGGDLALGDVTGDGRTDAVVTLRLTGELVVAAGDGAGGLLSPTEAFDVGAGPVALTLGRLDADGDLDAVVARDGDDAVAAFLNDGGGDFSAAGGTVALAGAPTDVALGDLTEDGLLDAVVTVDGGNPVLEGQGDGTFVVLDTFRAGRDPRTVAIADISNDRRPDALVVHAGSLTVAGVLNAGGGVFRIAEDLRTRDAGEHVALADFDRDGTVDFARTTADAVLVSPRAADGSLGPPVTLDHAGAAPGHLATDDADGDGDEDLVVIYPLLEEAGVWLGDGNGAFVLDDVVTTGPSPKSSVLVDLDGDGQPDYVVANAGASSLTVYLQGAGGGFPTTGVDVTVGAGPRDVAAADLDNDGDQDLVTANGDDGTFSVVLNDGAASFSVVARCLGTLFPPPCGTPAVPVSVVTLDGDRDGAADAAVLDALNGVIFIHLGDNTGDFVTVVGPIVVGPEQEALEEADTNRDGLPDLVTVSSTTDSATVLEAVIELSFAPKPGLVGGASVTVVDSAVAPSEKPRVRRAGGGGGGGCAVARFEFLGDPALERIVALTVLFLPLVAIGFLRRLERRRRRWAT